MAMMARQDLISIVSGATGLLLILLCTIPSLSNVTSNFLSAKKYRPPKVYEDKDGAATAESMARFSALLPKAVIIALSVLGLTVSTIMAVLGILRWTKDGLFVSDWINCGAWTLLVLQSVGILLSKVSTETFELGIYGTISTFFLLFVTLIQDSVLAETRSEIGPVFPFVLRLILLLLNLGNCFANASLPRRPEIFKDGKIVDAAETETLFCKYSFSWAAPLLRLAIKKGSLDIGDLPALDHKTRSKDATQAWIKADRKHTLWVNIALHHKWALILQWAMTLFQAVGNLTPQFVLLNVLKLLEKRIDGDSISTKAWIWVIALGLSTTLSAWFESWLFWISQADVAIPIRAELASLIFQKAMRRKDIKGAIKQSKKEDTDCANGVSETEGKSMKAKKPEKDKKEDSEDALTKQATINLIAVDARRVSDFASYNNYFIGSLFKLIVSFAFLIALIGWKALVAGIGTMLLIMPLNIYFSKRYAVAQGRLMKMRDEKLGVVTEALQGLRQLKFMSIERQWQNKIGAVRTRELAELWASFKADTMVLLCWISSPILFSAVSLSVYAAIYGELTPSIAFTAIGIFKTLEVTLAVIPELTTMLIDAYVSIKRVEKYLDSPEVSSHKTDSPNVSFDNASFSWPSDEGKEEGDQKYVLRNVTVSFPKDELSVISGKTGSGKSMLLSAILGEVDILSGSINVPKPPSIWDRRDDKATRLNWINNSIAYVAQIPWIENATIKDNILFGLPFHEDRYNKTIEACALRKDLAMLPDGENTEIGANGINLSGGQKWRLTFARALYSRAGILVLDDIFSAVDTHVGRFIFEEALTGELGRGRTRILVTHHVSLCMPRTKYLVELGDGTVQNAGFVSDLEEDGTLNHIISQEDKEFEEDGSTTVVNLEGSLDVDIDGELLKKVDTRASAKKFVEEEKREKGAISRTVYQEYFSASGGIPFWATACVLFVGQQVITVGRSWWLKLWTGSYEGSNTTVASIYGNLFQPSMIETSRVQSGQDTLMYYLGVYIGISILTSLIGTLQFFYIFTGSLRASKKLFEKLSWTVLRAPLRWIDTVPLGRILNRFTADLTVVDSRVAIDVSFFVSQSVSLCGIIAASLFVSAYILLLALVLAIMCLYYASRYIIGAREVKRLESNARTPIFEQFGSALSGVATIRASDNTDRYIQRMYAKQDDHSSTMWYLWLFNRWIGWRMSMAGALFAVTVAAIIITIPHIDAALAGFALSFSLEYAGAIIWAIRYYTNLELDLNAAERIIEYSNIPTESQDGTEPPAAWPFEGRLEVSDLVVGYAPDLPPVLRGLSFRIERNERVGVVGRTGAGKSSLTLALFRFLEAREGNILIDGLDISKIQLHFLRSRLAIIPQDPVLFSGTVRSNLDAFDEHTDAELRDALLRVHLISSPPIPPQAEPVSLAATTISQNQNKPLSLSSPITESGLNLSQGQRQLLCLARALVSRPKILILDEATSAVDMVTDTLIQRSIREEFNDSTLIVIAHRLSTIADFDKILVMEEGRCTEFGTPKELWDREGGKGTFRKMVEDSGERAKLEDLIAGSGEGSSS